MIPIGEFEDGADLSWFAGARLEFQRTNALGKKHPLTWYMRGAYSDVSLDAELESVLEMAGEETSSSLILAGAGLRAYSRSTPLFLQTGAGYLRYSPPGDLDAVDGLVLDLGLGFHLPFEAIQAEAVAAIHEALLDSDEGFGEEDLQFLTVSAGVSIPF
jgi:hypothetical protein